MLIACLNIAQVIAEIPNAELINQQTDLSVRNSKLYIIRSYELKINNRLGEEHTEISIPYSKMSNVSKIVAYIKDKEGIVVKKLKLGDVRERSSIAEGTFYEDDFVKEFTLNHNVYPYTICYSYQLQEDAFLYLDRWFPVIDYDVPTLNATLTLDIPLDYKIAFSTRLIESCRTDTLDSRIKYSWTATYKDQMVTEIYTPDKRLFMPGVEIVPFKFKYDREGSFSNWKSYGNWEFSLLEGLDELPENEKLHINRIIEGVTKEKEKIRLLYHYLQDATRYINISIETGGMKPYAANYVAANKYGDCKGLGNYFRSVLSYVHIPSFYTNVYGGGVNRKIDLSFPSMQFNHIILCVPLLKDTLWLDCTSDGPFNYLGTFTQNRESFLIDKDNSHFKRTPSLTKQNVLETRNIQIVSETGNDVTAQFHSVLKGYSFEQLSQLTRAVSETKKTEIIRYYFIESGFEMIDYHLNPAHRDSVFITLDYTARANKLFKKYGNDLLISLIPFTIPAFKDPVNRKYPVQLDYPVNQQDTLLYQIPPGFEVSTIPKDQEINTAFGNYSIRYIWKNNRVEVIKSFVLNAGEYPLTKYKDFYRYIKNVYDIENFSYIVTKKQI